MPKTKFPETLAAAMKAEASQWVLGDALLKECPPGSKLDKIGDACKYLAENGIDYSEATLRKLRDVSKVFPADKLDGDGNVVKRGKRFPQEVSWSVHLIYQGYPNSLQEWVEGHPGDTLTASDARSRVKKLVEADKAKDAAIADAAVKKAEAAKEREAARNKVNQPPATPTPEPENTQQPVAAQPTQPEEKPQSNNTETVVTAAPPVEDKPATNETWEANSTVRFAAAVTAMMAELDIINNHAKSGNFGTLWYASVSSDLEKLDAALTKTGELIETVDDETPIEPPIPDIAEMEIGTVTH